MVLRGAHAGQLGGEARNDRDRSGARVVAQKSDDVLDDLVHGYEHDGVAPPPREIDQLAQHARDAGHLLADDGEGLALAIRLLAGQLKLRLDRGQRVADVVRHPRGQQAEGRHLLLMHHLHLDLLLGGHDARDLDHRLDFTAGSEDGIGLHLHGFAAARRSSRTVPPTPDVRSQTFARRRTPRTDSIRPSKTR